MRIYVRIFLLCLLVLYGCASMFMKGGELVKAGYKPQKILVTYKAEGTVPPGVEYLLIETEQGPAIFERSGDGSGTLFLTRWQDKQGDHFAGWVASSHGYEFVISRDKKGRKGKRYVYPAGTYEVKVIHGIERPVSIPIVEPVATLIPKK
jgi:hypothetical protein